MNKIKNRRKTRRRMIVNRVRKRNPNPNNQTNSRIQSKQLKKSRLLAKGLPEQMVSKS